MIRPVLFALLLVLSPASAQLTVADPSDSNEPPLVDAGLDQTVERGTTVILDGLGSRDPDGRLASFRWTITTPSGRTVDPVDRSAPRTSFRPRERGRYTVVLSATDDSGTSRTDTLYVTVTPGAAPQVSLSGPDRLRVGRTGRFVADLHRGTAPLAELAWRVDGTLVETTVLDPNQQTAGTDLTFGMTGDHRVTVTLRDADGLSATAIAIPSAFQPRPPLRPRDAPAGGRDRRPVDATPSYAPTVHGPQLVTGAQPLDAAYAIRTSTPDDVTSVEWFDERGRVATGSTLQRTWSPGRHSLFAVVTYEGRLQTVARFTDGSTSVVADPRPAIRIANLTGTDAISGRALGSDAYGNLRKVRVRIGEQTIAQWPETDVGSIGRPVEVRELAFRTADFEHGETYRVTASATDNRGQQVTATREVEFLGTPTVVESGFVNGPVDSYDHRIDADRYTAHHVLKLDLNGHDPEEITLNYRGVESAVSQITRHPDAQTTIYNEKRGVLESHTYWSGETPGTYHIEWKSTGSDGLSEEKLYRDRFRVTPSKPEIRLKVTYDGTPHTKARWGIVVDAGASFDPDDSKLRYIWKQGAVPISTDNTTAKFASFERATLVLEDQYGKRATQEDMFHSFYVPPTGVTQVSDRAYLPNETVPFRIQTDIYALSKRTYSIDLGVETGDSEIAVKNWHRTIDYVGLEDDRQWSGTLDIPASAFLNGEPITVTVFNKGEPEIARLPVTVPVPTVLVPGGSVRENVTVTNLRYHVRIPVEATVTVQRESAKKAYLSEGYHVESVSNRGVEYTIERYQKVADAVYRTDTEAFRSSSYRRMFLRNNPSWHDAGTKRTTRRWTTTETEWRDYLGGKGSYTGHSRQVQTEPAEYRTERQYRYEYVSNGRILTGTYWAFGRYTPSDVYTGQSRRVKIDDAEYATEYEFEYEVHHESTTWYYLAERQVKVQSAKYDWRIDTVTKDNSFARRLLSHPDYRIRSTKSIPRWTLSKQIGTMTDVRSTYDDPAQVLETRATVTGTLTKRFLNPDTDQWRNVSSTSFSQEYTADVAKSRHEIVQEVRSVGDEKSTCHPHPIVGRCQTVGGREQ